MIEYRIISEGGKFYIQKKKDATWYRKKPKWRYLECGEPGLEDRWWTDSVERAEKVMAELIDDARKAKEPFKVVREV